VRLQGVGSGRPAAARGRVARADGLAACAERHVTPATADTRPPRRVLLFSISLVAGLAVVLATHRQQARALWGSLTAVPPAALAVVLLLVLCQLAFQAVRLWTILPRGVALPLGQTAHAFALGEWLNIFTPARGGDAFKVVMLSRAARGLAALHGPFKLAAGVSLSLGAWLAELAALRVLCTALAFAPSPARLVLVLAALNLGISVPIGLANMGVYEAVLSLGLTHSGIPLATAAAIAMLHHALQLLGTNVGAAGLSLWAEGRCPRPP